MSDVMKFLDRYRIALDPYCLEHFFLNALRYQDELPYGPCPRNYFEFGVSGGRILMKYLRALEIFREKRKDIDSFNITVFDSFRGLPEKKDERDNYPGWDEGVYSNDINVLKKRMIKNRFRNRIKIVPGFFKESLTKSLRESLISPSIVVIDVDYYSSTKEVMEWLTPILHSGTLFYFDDLWSFHGNPKYGELAAIKEFNENGVGTFVEDDRFGCFGTIFTYYRNNYEFLVHG